MTQIISATLFICNKHFVSFFFFTVECGRKFMWQWKIRHHEIYPLPYMQLKIALWFSNSQFMHLHLEILSKLASISNFVPLFLFFHTYTFYLFIYFISPELIISDERHRTVCTKVINTLTLPSAKSAIPSSQELILHRYHSMWKYLPVW